MIFSIIQKSQLEGALRLDAEYYQPEYLSILDNILELQPKKLVELADKVFSGPFGSTLKSESYQQEGIPFIRIGDIADIFIEKENLVYISEDEHKRIYSTHLKPGDIVLSKIGTVGRLSVIDEDLGEVNISENNIGVRLQDLTPPMRSFVLFFLLSEFGQKQIFRKASGNVQLKLNVQDIEDVIIPFSQNTDHAVFEELYRQILKAKEDSKTLYSQAEEMLLEELGLSFFTKTMEDEERFCIVNFSEIQSANRMDAEYFQLKYEKLISKLKSQNAKSLEEIFLIRRGDFINPNYYVENAKRAYIRIKELPIKGDLNKAAVVYIDDSFKEGNIDTLKENDFVFAGIGATLGKVARITEELQGSFYSNNTACFRMKKEYENKLNPQYAEIVLQSMVCQLQFEQRQAQTAQAKIADEELKTVLLPILPKETQQKIAELIRQSHEARKKAKQLLEEAKHRVEQMIESQSTK